MIRIDVYASRELQDLIRALKASETSVAKQIRQQSQRVIGPEWKKGLTERATTRMEIRALSDTSRVSVTDQNVTLKAGAVKGRFRNGFDARINSRAVEFGANRNAKRKYQATRNGKSYTVNRRTRAQFKPTNSKGYVVYPTAGDLIPRIARLWVQTAVREIHEQLEK